MPRIRSKQILGETPINANDITTKEYVDSLFSSLSGGTTPTTSGSSVLTVEDESITVMSGVSYLNFRGVDVTALKGSGSNRVDIWIPRPIYAPFFNNDEAIISDVSTTNRYISSPISEGNPFNIGSWSGGNIRSTIRDDVNLTYQTNSEFNIDSLITTFTANIYDADGATLLAQNSITLTSNITYSSNNITIIVSDWDSDSDKYKANISIEYDMSSILPNGGRFNIELIHNNDTAGEYKYTQNNIFKDSETNIANISGSLTVNEGSTIKIKTISGVYFYDLNTEWDIFIDGLNNLNGISYPTTSQLNITETNFFISSDIEAHGEKSEFSNWSRLYNSTNASYNNPSWITDEENYTNWNHTNGVINDTNATGTIYDWESVDSLTSDNYNYLIDTLQDISDRNTEIFRSEIGTYPRLNSDLSTSWNNTESLLIEDGGNGLQIIGDRLVYPQYDFTIYHPNISLQPNYSSTSGDKVYYRKFETDGTYASTGMIRLSTHNITENDINNGYVIIELSIDNGLTWNTMSGQYVGGVISNGDSIRTYVDDYNLEIGAIENNSMSFALPASSTFIHMKITYTESAKNKYIGLISIDNNSNDGGAQW